MAASLVAVLPGQALWEAGPEHLGVSRVRRSSALGLPQASRDGARTQRRRIVLPSEKVCGCGSRGREYPPECAGRVGGAAPAPAGGGEFTDVDHRLRPDPRPSVGQAQGVRVLLSPAQLRRRGATLGRLCAGNGDLMSLSRGALAQQLHCQVVQPPIRATKIASGTPILSSPHELLHICGPNPVDSGF